MDYHCRKEFFSTELPLIQPYPLALSNKISSQMLESVNLNQAAPILLSGKFLLSDFILFLPMFPNNHPSNHVNKPTTRFGSPNFKILSYGYKFVLKISHLHWPCHKEIRSNPLHPSPKRPRQLTAIIQLGVRDQFYPPNIWIQAVRPDQEPAFKGPKVSPKNGFSAMIIQIFMHQSIFMSETFHFIVKVS